MKNHSRRIEGKFASTCVLTLTGKMPSFSFSLPARVTCPGSTIGENLFADGSLESETETVCSDCYAFERGNYRFSNVKLSQATRLEWTLASLADGTFADTIIGEISRLMVPGDPILGFFRIDDSGDLFSVAYIEAWIKIAQACPDIRFWAPTRSYLAPQLLPAILRLAALPNVTIRPSALQFDVPAPVVEGLHAGSSVHDAGEPQGYACPAQTTANTCGSCRTCWLSHDVEVSYPRH